LKENDYEGCIRLCDMAMKKIDLWLKWVNYSQGVGSSAFCIPMMSKLRLRKAKALQGLQKEKEALDEIKKVL